MLRGAIILRKMTMDKKSVIGVATGYFLWGVLPLYWRMLSNLDPFMVLANRIIWSAVFTIGVLMFRKRLSLLRDAFKNKSVLKVLLPSAIFITINWGLYIYSVSVNRVMDASLGYYMNPLMVFAFGMILFKEKFSRIDIFALFLAFAGVLISAIQFGEFPYIAIILALMFAMYGALKKNLDVDGVTSVSVETIIVTPLALLYAILSPTSQASFSIATPFQYILLVMGGAITALPLILYSSGIKKIPFMLAGFLQYVTPTCMMIIGIANGEPFGLPQLISFGCIWAGLVLFTIGMVKKSKAQKESTKQTV